MVTVMTVTTIVPHPPLEQQYSPGCASLWIYAQEKVASRRGDDGTMEYLCPEDPDARHITDAATVKP
jgi:hypothetical protein